MILEPKTCRQKGGRPTRPRFRGLVQYMLQGKGTERCTWYLAGNLEGLERREDAETAIKVVGAYQRRNTRAKRDKTYHLVISLHPDDRSLDEHELERVVRRAVEVAGLGEHHYIAVRHNDQEHEHVHVAVSKIHPRTLKIHHPWKDIEQFKALATDLERELGLHQVDRPKDRQRTAPSFPSRQFEAVRGEESFARWARTTIGETFNLRTIGEWEELHTRLVMHGVRLVARGNGLALIDVTRSNLHCKASALGRQWSKQRLTERYGEFRRSQGEALAHVQHEPYQPKPLGLLRDDGLWHEYQRERTETQRVRTQTCDQAAARIKRARDSRGSRSKLRHHAIQALPIARKDKRALYRSFGAERLLEQKIRTARAGAQLPAARTWKEFLAERAANGDSRAARRLARQNARRAPGIRSSGHRPLLREGQRTSRGTQMHDFGHVKIRESSDLLELVGNPTPDALARLAGLAEDRFRGSPVQVLGSRAVKEQLEELIRERDLRTVSARERAS